MQQPRGQSRATSRGDARSGLTSNGSGQITPNPTSPVAAPNTHTFGAAQMQADVMAQQSQQPTKLDIIRMNVSELSEQQKKMMIVEERYSFFQIENKLRQLCQESVDNLRVKITKEADIVRRVQITADQAKRDVQMVEPRLEKALQANAAISKVMHEITNLESNIRIEAEKVTAQLEVMETEMTILEGKMQSNQQAFHIEMSRVEDLKETVRIGLNQIQTYKEEHSAKTDKTVEGYRMHVAELEAPQNQMKKDMKRLQQEMVDLTKECNARKIQQDVTDQRLNMAMQRIQELQKDKADQRAYDKLQFKTASAEEAANVRYEQLEKTLKDTIDYVVRYQWKETRNIVNRAMTKVVRPLQLKDLFYVNVGGNDHAIFQQQLSAVEKQGLDKLKELDNENKDKKLESQPSMNDVKSVLSKATSFKTPAVVLTDFKFTPEETTDPIPHPILGTPQVRNIHEVDWESLKFAQQKEWAEVCQEHYDLVVKLGNAPSEPSKKAPSTLDVSKQKAAGPKVGLAPLKNLGKKKKKKKKGAKGSMVTIDPSDPSAVRESGGRSGSKPKKSKKDKKEKRDKKEKKEKKPRRDDTAGKISVDDQELLKVVSESKKDKKNKRHKDKKEKKNRKETIEVGKSKFIKAEDSLQQDSIQMPEQNVMLNQGLTSHQSQIQALNNATSAKSSLQGADVAVLTQSVELAFENSPDLKAQAMEKLGGMLSNKQSQFDQLKQNSTDTTPEQGGNPASHLDVTKVNIESKEHSIRQSLNQKDKESIESSSSSDSDSDDSSSSDSDSDDSGSDDSGSEDSEYDVEYDDEGYEENEDEADQDAADGEALGIDLTRFFKKTEFYFYKEKIKEKIDELINQIKKQEERLETQVTAKGEEYSKGITIIEAALNEHMKPVREDMVILLKTRQRQQSDDLIAQSAIIDRFNAIKQEFDSLVQTVDFTLCPMVSCLFENSCIQLQCEEQEDLDKLKIALYGHKDGIQKQAETAAFKEKSFRQTERNAAKQSQKRTKESMRRGSTLEPITQRGGRSVYDKTTEFNAFDSVQIGSAFEDKIVDTKTLNSSAIRTPRSTTRLNSGQNIKVVQSTQQNLQDFEQSLFEASKLRSSGESQEKTNFLQSVMESHFGETKERLSVLLPNFNVEKSAYMHQSVWQKREQPMDLLKLEQKCLNCTSEVEHNAKLFKIACLAYTPSKVNYRGQAFTKQQLMAIRKFLVGQTAQLVFQSVAMKRMNLSPKRVFDDIYLHLETQATNKFNISDEAYEQFKLIENEHNQAGTMRSIFFKTRQAAASLMEISLQNSQDYSQYNTCDDYLNSSRTVRNKFAPQRQHIDSQGTEIGLDDIGLANQITNMPLTARGDTKQSNFNDRRKHSLEFGRTAENSRNAGNITTAPHNKRPSAMRMTASTNDFQESLMSNTFGPGQVSSIKPNFLNIDIKASDMPNTAGTGASVFTNKRHTVQPISHVREFNRSLANQSDPLKMSQLTKKVMGKSGCHKEQQKQYVNYVNEATKNNIALRQKIQSQQTSQSVYSKRANETPRALIAIMPIQDMNDHGNAVTTTKKDNVQETMTNFAGSPQKKNLPPISIDGQNSNTIQVKKTSDIQLT